MLCQFLLYSKVNQLYVYVYPHIPSLLRFPPTLPTPPLQVVTKHQADLPVLCSSFPLAIQLHLVVYICQCYSLTSSQLPLHPQCPQVCSLCLRLYSCPAPRFFRSFFFLRFYIYVLAYGICFSFSDLLHSYDRLQVHPPHYK